MEKLWKNKSFQLKGEALTRWWMVAVSLSMFHVPRFTFHVPRSMFHVPRSMFHVSRCQALTGFRFQTKIKDKSKKIKVRHLQTTFNIFYF